MVDEIIFDVKDAEKMGLHSEALYIIEYDLNSRRLIPQDFKVCPKCDSRTENLKTLFCQKCGADMANSPVKSSITEAEKEERIRYNKVANEIRNKLFFALKFQIMATKHLESSWLISQERLPEAVKAIDALKEEMRRGSFDNVDKRIRIIPIMTTEDGFENYEDQKIQFLLQFCFEHIQYCDKALDEQRMPKSSLWRCKKAYEIINLLADELKTEDAKHEVKDESELLSDKVSQVEAMMQRLDDEVKAGI